MNFGKTRNLTLVISKHLEVNALNTKNNLGNFDAKSNVGIFLGYSSSSKAYRI